MITAAFGKEAVFCLCRFPQYMVYKMFSQGYYV